MSEIMTEAMMQRSNKSCQNGHKMDYAATRSDMIATIAGPRSWIDARER
jgi:hypothetical protein